MDPTIQALWVEYKSAPTLALRDRLVLHYAPLVKFVAGRIGSGLPASVDQQDLVSSGIFGLIDAIEKFDLERGLKFETYAIPRINGAILDELRSLDWMPRSVRTKKRAVENAYRELEVELQRTPTEDEVADRVGMTVADLRSLMGQINYRSVIALDDLLHRTRDGDDAPVTLAESLADTRFSMPGEELERDDIKQSLFEAIREMDNRDRTVITLYYFEGLTLAEIGQVLGVTESRVCQLHTRACLSLKAKLEARSITSGTVNSVGHNAA